MNDFTGCILLATGICSGCLTLEAANLPAVWPQFRGPESRGIAENAKPPIQFGPETNLMWKTEVPAGHSSPIVVSDRIIFNAAEGKKLLTCAIDRKTGRNLWRAEVSVEHLEKFHEANTAAPCTPATDGQHVVSYLPSFGLIAHDLDGRELWRKPMSLPQTFRSQGSGASPLIAGGRVIVELPVESAVDIIAVRTTDGSEAWKISQPLRTMGWGTPVTWKEGAGECFGLIFGGQFSAYGLTDGKELWSVKGLGAEACATPVVMGDRILLRAAGVQGEPANMTIPPEFKEALKLWDKNGDGRIVRNEIPTEYLLTDRQASGGKGNMTLRQMMGWFQREESDRGYDAEGWEKLREMLRSFRDGEMNRPTLTLVRTGGQGDVSKSHVLWQEAKGVPEIPSPLVYRDHIYLVRSGGLLACRALETGKMLFNERLGAPGGYFASPLGADGRVYIASDGGIVTVVEAAEELHVLARNDLGEGIFASPAAVDETLYIRSTGHLWAFGK
jgi:outer membrane protein assembly factor BamB